MSHPQTIQIMTGFMHIGFGIILTTLTKVYTSVFVIGEIPFLGGVSVRGTGGCPTGWDTHAGGCPQRGMPTGERCPRGGCPRVSHSS